MNFRSLSEMIEYIEKETESEITHLTYWKKQQEVRINVSGLGTSGIFHPAISPREVASGILELRQRATKKP